jgi:periplasmic divalent cation tolerance protein
MRRHGVRTRGQYVHIVLCSSGGYMDGFPDELLLVLCTAPPADSSDIARVLLKERLAACVNRYPVNSTFWWEGKVVSEDEFLMVIKTEKHLFDAVERIIEEMHPYDIPEIIAVPVVAASGEYSGWVRRVLVSP